MVIRQSKASGPITETLLSEVSLNDVVSLIAFAFATIIAEILISLSSTFEAFSLLTPFIEVIFNSFWC